MAFWFACAPVHAALATPAELLPPLDPRHVRAIPIRSDGAAIPATLEASRLLDRPEPAQGPPKAFTPARAPSTGGRAGTAFTDGAEVGDASMVDLLASGVVLQTDVRRLALAFTSPSASAEAVSLTIWYLINDIRAQRENRSLVLLAARLDSVTATTTLVPSEVPLPPAGWLLLTGLMTWGLAGRSGLRTLPARWMARSKVSGTA